MVKEMTYVGLDFWDRPTYLDSTGRVWKNTELKFSDPANLYSTTGNELEGEPDIPLKKDVYVVFNREPEPCPYESKIRLLSRLISDCNFFLCTGGTDEKSLWGKTVEEHISAMNDLYSAIPRKWRPAGITRAMIRGYKKRMMDAKKHSKELITS